MARQATGFRMKFEQIVALPARLTANLLNSYVDFLGYDALALAAAPHVAAGERSPSGVSRRDPRRAAARN
jgi:hypothetical protein